MNEALHALEETRARMELFKTESEEANKRMFSQYVSYEDACYAPRGISNTPNTRIKQNIILLSRNVYDQLVMRYGPIFRILSFFKSKSYMNKIGLKFDKYIADGCSMSLAIKDNVKDPPKLSEVFDYIYKELPYHKIIWPYNYDTDNEDPLWITIILQRRINIHRAYKEVYNEDTNRTELVRTYRCDNGWPDDYVIQINDSTDTI